jgi:hypothetical protein
MSRSISTPGDVAGMLDSSPQAREQRAWEAIALELYRSSRPEQRRQCHGLKRIAYRRPEFS